ncbi:MAG: FtsX-like permease family protein [Pseudomonadota bacterium]
MKYSTVIAFRMLVHNKARCMLALCAIAFAVLVLFMAIGFFNGLNDSQANIAAHLNADLVMLNKKTRSINSFRRMDRARLYQALAFPEIREVVPVYEGQVGMITPASGMGKRVGYRAFPVGSAPFLINGRPLETDLLKEKGAILFDTLSRSIYGDVRTGMSVEIIGLKHRVVGSVRMGPNFSQNGYVLMSDTTYAAPRDPWVMDQISYGLLRVAKGTDIPALRQRVLAQLPDDILIMTPEELRVREIFFTTRTTPVGALLGIGLIVGFIIGIIICYQILFNEVTDHMPQFATLKAVGFSTRFLVGVVMKEALLLSVIGYLPGLLAGHVLYTVIEQTTRIIMILTPGRGLSVFLLTIFMCCIAGFIAVRKVLAADPAELF